MVLRRVRIAFVALGLALVVLVAPLRLAWAESVPDVEIYTREGCPRCDAAKAYLHELSRRRPDVTVKGIDVSRDPAARRHLTELTASRGVSAASVPTLVVRGTLVVGWSEASTPARVEALLAATSSSPTTAEEGGTCSIEESTECEPTPKTTIVLPVFGRIDVRTIGMPLFTLAVALVDGFNPCAMWVLLLLLALLVNLHSRTKMALVAGVFVTVSGLAYFAFMAAWLNAFLLVGISRAVQVVLGVVAVGVGSVHVKDFFALHQGVSLSIPESAKPGIYARMRAIVTAEHLVSALAAASVLAVMVNVIELLCTAGLPALYTEVLASQGLAPWKRYAYLGLYNVAYMADDILMVVVAVATLGRRKLQEHAGRWLKLLSGSVIIAVGVLLIAKPEWLVWR